MANDFRRDAHAVVWPQRDHRDVDIAARVDVLAAIVLGDLVQRTQFFAVLASEQLAPALVRDDLLRDPLELLLWSFAGVMHHAVADPVPLVALDGGEHLLRHRHAKTIEHRAVVSNVLLLGSGVLVGQVRIDHFAAALDGAEHVVERSVVAEHHFRVVAFVNVLAHCAFPFSRAGMCSMMPLSWAFGSSASACSITCYANCHSGSAATPSGFPNSRMALNTIASPRISTCLPRSRSSTCASAASRVLSVVVFGVMWFFSFSQRLRAPCSSCGARFVRRFRFPCRLQLRRCFLRRDRPLLALHTRFGRRPPA